MDLRWLSHGSQVAPQVAPQVSLRWLSDGSSGGSQMAPQVSLTWLSGGSDMAPQVSLTWLSGGSDMAPQVAPQTALRWLLYGALRCVSFVSLKCEAQRQKGAY